jgi:glycosyltransferase involved in cell wall biosynthesis
MRVLIGTPAHDGRVESRYMLSVHAAVQKAAQLGHEVSILVLNGDPYIQRARNSLIKAAIDGKFEHLIFIDSDISFPPEWLVELLLNPEHVVGGTYRHKLDEKEMYAVKTTNLKVSPSGLISVDALATGFVKISVEALSALWNSCSAQQQSDGGRMMCNVEVQNGEFFGEDTVLFKKLAALGYPPWLAPHMTCDHSGPKVYCGNFVQFAQRLANE